MTRYMLVDPGAIAHPIREISAGPTSKALRAWKVSDAEEMIGAKTA